MATNNAAEIDAKVKEGLRGTRFEATSLSPLSGGSVNWTYLAKLKTPLEDGTTEVMVKHGETHMMSKPEVALTLIRCVSSADTNRRARRAWINTPKGIEAECFRYLSYNPFAGKADPTASIDVVVRTPRYYHYDEQATNQFLEYLPGGISLKDYILKYYKNPSAEFVEIEARQVGKALGSWLRSFARWSATQSELRATAAENVEAQSFRHMLEFGWLAERVAQYSAILGDAKDIFAEVEKVAAAEIQDEDKLQVVHGDFWTGKYVKSLG